MNQIRAIQALNKREIENGVPPEASWHTDYRDTAFVNFGGLPYELSEGDIITIFSQFGEPVFLKLVRDRETGKSKGFGWLKYEDQRSTDLAVDNLGGSEINGRMIRVDHARYKPHDDDDPEEGKIGWEDMLRRERAEKGDATEEETEGEEDMPRRPLLKEEKELQLLIENHDDDDPMKEFLVEEKKKEVDEALRRERRKEEKHKMKHRDRDGHHRSHRAKRLEDGNREKERRRDREHHRSRSRDRENRESRRPRRDDTPNISRVREEEGSEFERGYQARGSRHNWSGDSDHDRRRGDRESRRARDGLNNYRRGRRQDPDEDRSMRDRRNTRSRSPRR